MLLSSTIMSLLFQKGPLVPDWNYQHATIRPSRTNHYDLPVKTLPRASPRPPPPPPTTSAASNIDCKELVSCEHFGPEYDAEEDSSTVSTTKESLRGMRTTTTVDETASVTAKPKRPASSSYGRVTI